MGTSPLSATLPIFAFLGFWCFLLPEEGCGFLSVKQMEEMKNGLGGGMFQPGCELQLTSSVGSGSLIPLSRTQDGSDGGSCRANALPFSFSGVWEVPARFQPQTLIYRSPSGRRQFSTSQGSWDQLAWEGGGSRVGNTRNSPSPYSLLSSMSAGTSWSGSLQNPSAWPRWDSTFLM